MKKIIIATDFSNEADNAMLYAANICREHGYELILFTLRNMSIHKLNARLSNQSIDEISIQYQNEIDDFASSIGTAFGIPVTTYLASGDFCREINRCFTQSCADFVVIGMAKQSLKHDFSDDANTSIIEGLKIPVLIVPLFAKYNGIKNMLFVSHQLRELQTKELDAVRALTTDFNAVLKIFQVSNKIRYLESSRIVNAIENEIIEFKADLLIMTPKNEDSGELLAHRNKTIEIAFRCHIALFFKR